MTHFMSSNSPSGGMKLMLLSVSNLLSFTHCKTAGSSRSQPHTTSLVPKLASSIPQANKLCCFMPMPMNRCAGLPGGRCSRQWRSQPWRCCHPCRRLQEVSDLPPPTELLIKLQCAPILSPLPSPPLPLPSPPLPLPTPLPSPLTSC